MRIRWVIGIPCCNRKLSAKPSVESNHSGCKVIGLWVSPFLTRVIAGQRSQMPFSKMPATVPLVTKHLCKTEFAPSQMSLIRRHNSEA